MEQQDNLTKDRAWIEISESNLKNNINEIKNALHENCEIMAVVKANAYGHGIIGIAKSLNKLGIYNFAVATLSEGIELRNNDIKGNILILGYTHFEDIKYVIKYDLIQTLMDYNYANMIQNMELKDKLKAHIKINTGMNRIGESYTNIENIKKIYEMKSLKVEGIYTHLCVADSNEKEDIEYTHEQIKHFYECVDRLKSKNIDIGKTHIQSSYGLLNYPEIKCDYVRIGIAMYGVYSTKGDITKIKLNLKPILSLKARITSIKTINAGEFVSYGRTFKADVNTKIATVSIGYADGYPRNLSNKNSKVKINGMYAEIIGRICMDQLIINVSNIPKINVGDIVTLIGEEQEISANEIAYKSDTITNELLSRLENRLGRIIE